MNFKYLFFIITFIASSIYVNAQEDTNEECGEMPKSMSEVGKQLENDTVLLYYNSRYQLVKPECAEIIRKIKIDISNASFDGDFNDFNSDSTIAMTGSYKNGKKNGDFYIYYPNGQLQSTGKFLDNKKTGIWNYWYDNGNNHQKLEFKDDETLIVEFWNEKNEKLVDNGTGKWYIYETSEKFIKIEGNVVNYRKEGKWKRSIPSRNFIMNEENYKQGKFIDGKFISMINPTEKYTDKILCVIEPPLPFNNAESFQMNMCCPKTDNNRVYATYPGGMDNFYREIKDKFSFPEIAIENEIKGLIEIQTTISTDGRMANFKKVSNLGFGLEDELIRVLQTLKK